MTGLAGWAFPLEDREHCYIVSNWEEAIRICTSENSSSEAYSRSAKMKSEVFCLQVIEALFNQWNVRTLCRNQTVGKLILLDKNLSCLTMLRAFRVMSKIAFAISSGGLAIAAHLHGDRVWQPISSRTSFVV